MIDLFDPVAGVLVVGGTLLTAVLRAPGRDVGRAVVALRTLPRGRFAADALLGQIAAQTRIAERHGVLQLDRAVIADADIAAAMAAIVDGRPADQIAELLRYRRRSRAERHAAAADVWAGAAEAAPAMGMIGTLVGLAGAFATMTDASAIGAAMAIALLATLYGALLANLVAAPIAARLRTLARAESFERARLEAPLVALAVRETPRMVRAA
jgi:chemotaxis protein MotA